MCQVHLETYEDSFLRLTKAKRLLKKKKGRILFPLLSVSTPTFHPHCLRIFCLNSSLNINIYFLLCLAVQSHLKDNSTNHQHHLVRVSIQFLPCALGAHEYNYLLTVAVTNPLITTKAYILQISFSVANGNKSQKLKYTKKIIRGHGEENLLQSTVLINLLSLL